MAARLGANEGGSTITTSNRRPVLGHRRHHLEGVAERGVDAVRPECDPAGVGGHVGAGGLDRTRTLIDEVDRRRAGRGGVDAESAGATEDVEHGATGAVGGDQGPVLALIEERARLLPAHHVGGEVEPELAIGDRGARGFADDCESVGQRRRQMRGGEPPGPQDDAVRAERDEQRRDDVVEVRGRARPSTA